MPDRSLLPEMPCLKYTFGPRKSEAVLYFPFARAKSI